MPSSDRHLLHVFPTFGIGGVQVRIADVANRLGDRFHHTFLALDGATGAGARLWPETRFAIEADVPAGGLRRLPDIARRLKSSGADLVCTYNWGSMDWCLAAGLYGIRPHIHFESGFGPEEALRPLRRRSLYRRIALRGAYALVTPAHNLETIARDRHWIAARRIRLIPNGVDVRWYRRSQARTETETAPGSAAQAAHIVAIAPLRAEKRLDRLIAACAALGDRVTLTVCGAGPERRALEAQAEAAGIAARVRLAGELDDIRPALEAADIFAMTSETEQMPNALLQAMAMELPVVAYDAGDIARILPPEQRALVFAQDDTAGFEAGLTRLAEDPKTRYRFGRANRERVCADYDMTGMVEAYRALYEEAIAAG